MVIKLICWLSLVIFALMPIRGGSATLPFVDTFSGAGHVDGSPDPDWNVVAGTWILQSGKYVSTPDSSWKYSIVKDLSLDYGYASVECTYGNGGLIARWKDAQDFLFVNLYAYGLLLIRPESDGGWQFVWGAWHSNGGRNPVDGDRMRCQAWIKPGRVSCRIDDLDTGGYAEESIQFDYTGWNGIGCFSYSVSQWDDFQAQAIATTNIGEVKKAGPGTRFDIRGIVSAVFTDLDCFYVESEDRSSAIKVTPLPAPTPAVGAEVVVTGTTAGDGTLAQEAVGATGRNVSIRPVGVNNRDITGAVGNPGLSNMDLLVTTWGRLLCDPVAYPDGSRRIYITDGLAASQTPTALVYDPSNSEVVFQDDFDAGKKPDWLNVGVGTTSVVAGKLVNNTASSTNLEVVDGVDPRDVSVKVQARSGEACGLVARYTDQTHHIVGWYRNNRLVVYEYNPNSRLICSAVNTPLLTGTVLIYLKVVGDKVTFSATDGTNDYATVGTVGTRWEPGTVGLCRDSSSQWTHFDNFSARMIGRKISPNAVEVVVPGSVVVVPTVATGNLVTVTGIVGRDRAMDGTAMRMVLAGANGLRNVPWLRIDAANTVQPFLNSTSRYYGLSRPRLGRAGAVWYYGEMDSVIRNGDGTLTCQWGSIDPAVDSLRAGCDNLMMPFAYMPDAVVDMARRTSFGLSIGLNCAPPVHYNEWQEICRQAVYHFNVTRNLGMRYWEVWNEPNGTGFWPGTFDEYLSLYTSAAGGAKAADTNAMVGGPVVSIGGPLSLQRPSINADMPAMQMHEFDPPEGWTPGAVPEYTNYSKDSPYELIAYFIDYCNRNGLPLDFLVWHNYNDAPDLDVHNLDSFGANARLFRSWLDRYSPFRDAEMVVDEWGVLTPTDAVTDTVFHCGGALEMAKNGVLCDYPAFTTQAASNAMSMFGMLGSQRVEESASPGLHVLATRTGPQGRVDILIVRLDKDSAAQPVTVKVQVGGLAANATTRWKRYVLDADHQELLTRRADLLVPVEDVTLPGGSNLVKDVTLAARGITLVRIQ